MGDQKKPGIKKLTKKHRVIWIDDPTHADHLQALAIIHDDNPRSVTYCNRTDVDSDEDDTEDGLNAKIASKGIKKDKIQHVNPKSEINKKDQI